MWNEIYLMFWERINAFELLRNESFNFHSSTVMSCLHFPLKKWKTEGYGPFQRIWSVSKASSNCEVRVLPKVDQNSLVAGYWWKLLFAPSDWIVVFGGKQKNGISTFCHLRHIYMIYHLIKSYVYLYYIWAELLWALGFCQDTKMWITGES